MFIQIGKNNTIKLPKELLEGLKLNEGDILDSTITNGIIHLYPIKQKTFNNTNNNCIDFSPHYSDKLFWTIPSVPKWYLYPDYK